MDITKGATAVNVQNQVVSRAVPIDPCAPPHASGERDIPAGNTRGYDPLYRPTPDND